MKKYVVMLSIFLVLTTSTVVVAKHDANNNDINPWIDKAKKDLDNNIDTWIDKIDDIDDGIPKDDSWITKISPIITTDKNSRISKAEFILREDDIKNANSGMKTKHVFGSSGSCWKTFATWNSNTPVKYVINPRNSQGIDQSFITSAIKGSAETWDVVTPRELFSDTYSIDKYAKYGRYDGKNSIVFGFYPYPGVIAVTGIWYYTDTGQILEADMLFNTAYRWGDATIYPNRMDIRNIATHELGHVVGLDDIYDGTCSEVTMYGYGSVGETKKRTLEMQDKTGLLSLYP